MVINLRNVPAPIILTTVERLAIAAPYLAQVVFDTTASKYFYWDSTQWVEY